MYSIQGNSLKSNKNMRWFFSSLSSKHLNNTSRFKKLKLRNRFSIFTFRIVSGGK